MTVAVKNNRQIDEDLLLGNLEFHYIPSLKVHKDTLKDIFDRVGLPDSFMPEVIKGHDAYRRASSTGNRTIKINYNGKEQSGKLLVREIAYDDKRIVRHLVREVVDKEREKATYATVGKMEYDRNTQDMLVETEGGLYGEYDYDGVLREIQDTFYEWTRYHTKDTVRNIVNAILESLNPLSIMSRGKAQFIPKAGTETLYKVKDMLESLEPYVDEPGDNPEMNIIPYMDSVEQRELVTERLHTEVLHDAQSLMAEFAEKLTGRDTLEMRTVQRFAGCVAEMQAKVEDYENLLGVTMGLINEQLREAMDRIKSTPIDQGAK